MKKIIISFYFASFVFNEKMRYSLLGFKYECKSVDWIVNE